MMKNSYEFFATDEEINRQMRAMWLSYGEIKLRW